jgi:hypothetical protein
MDTHLFALDECHRRPSIWRLSRLVAVIVSSGCDNLSLPHARNAPDQVGRLLLAILMGYPHEVLVKGVAKNDRLSNRPF